MSNCCNEFEFTSPQGTFYMDGGIRGKDGVTFYPHVSAAGVLSWTNDGGKQNPDPVNIKGEDGMSAYAAAQEAGFTGTEQEFNAYLSGIGELTEDVNDLKSDVADITGNERLTTIISGAYINLSGTTADINSPVSSQYSEYLVAPCVESEQFTITTHGGSSGRAYGFISSDGTVLECAPASTNYTELVITAPANSAYLIVNSYKFNIIAWKGDLICKAVSIIKEKQKIESFLTPYGIEPFQMSLFKQSVNLFSDFCYHITRGYYRFRIATTPVMHPRITAANSWQGWLIRVKPETTYTLGPLDFKLELLDSAFNSDVTIENVSASGPNTITTGKNSYWLCLTMRLATDMSSWMMVEGDTYPAEYISGFPEWVAEPLKPGSGSAKTVAFFGDSITAGVATQKCYHQYIHDVYGYTCLNYGYGGSGWYKTSTSTNSGRIGQGVPGIGPATTPEIAFQPNNVLARLAELDASVVDCIVVFAGTNDWNANVPVSDFRTAIDTALEYCKTNYTNIPVIVMTPIRRRYDTVPNSNGQTLRDFADIIIEECIKYSIDYIDTMTVSELYPDNEQNRLLYFASNPDTGLHPSSAGHKRIAVGVGEQIERQLRYSEFATP